MAPLMAAVLRAPRKLCSFSHVLLFFLLFYVLDNVSIAVYDRHTLLNIGSSVAQPKPDFEFLNAGALFTDTASEPFVWAARLVRPKPRKCHRKRGKRAGVLVRLRLLANIQSLQQTLRTAGAHLIPTRNKGLLHYLPHRNLDVCNGSRLRPSSQGKAEVGASVSISTTRGVMKGTYTLLNPSAPLIWNFICFCVNHSGYRGSLQRSYSQLFTLPLKPTQTRHSRNCTWI